ncbi:retrotransposon protein, putative, ty1-copia subclass [Tanacetum coccineum]
MINSSRVVLSGIQRDNCVYSLDGHAMSGELNASVKEKDSLAQVWHKRLGYISEARLHVLEKQWLFGKKSLGKLGFCKNYVLGKSHRVSFGVGRHTTQGVIDYVHSDLWGPSQVESLGGKRSPSTAIEKKTPMEMWSGHPSDYEMLRIFGRVAYPNDKQGKLQPRAIKWVLLGYPKGLKRYRLYRLDDESPKLVTSKNVVFNESVMYKDTLKDSGADADKSVEELQAEVELQRLNNHTPEEDQTDQDGDDEDQTDQGFCSKWKAVMKEEMDSLRKNKTQELVDHPSGQKLVSYKWLFKIKEGNEGVQKPRYKTRLVARGFTRRAGIDYNEVFSPVIQHTSIWVILSLTAYIDYELEQLDVKTVFLHGNLEEVVYTREPPGYEQGNMVCLLKKSLYGLKQSPRQWYRRFDEYMLSNGFKRGNYDSCVYYRSYAPGEYIYLLLYIDDMLIACKSKAEIGSTKSLLKKEFDMKELGEVKKILGMEIVRDQSHKILRVSQSGYISKILNNFRIDNGKSVKMSLGGHFKLSLKDYPVSDCDVERMSKVSYANAVGSLMYLMVCTRPDIAYAVSVISRFLANPGKNHWETVKWILKYLRGTAYVGLVYGTDRGNHVDVTGFVDSDYAKDPDKGRSYTGYVFLVQGCVISWKAMLQHVVALSTTEAEYMALTEAVKEAIWLRGLLEELGVELWQLIMIINLRFSYRGIMKGLSTSICLDEGGTSTQVTTLLEVAECMDVPDMPIHEVTFSAIDKPKLLSQEIEALHEAMEKAVSRSEVLYFCTFHDFHYIALLYLLSDS